MTHTCMERLATMEDGAAPRFPELREPCIACSGIGWIKKRLYDERPDAKVPCRDCKGKGYRITDDLSAWLHVAKSLGQVSLSTSFYHRNWECWILPDDCEIDDVIIADTPLQAVTRALCLATGGQHDE